MGCQSLMGLRWWMRDPKDRPLQSGLLWMAQRTRVRGVDWQVFHWRNSSDRIQSGDEGHKAACWLTDLGSRRLAWEWRAQQYFSVTISAFFVLFSFFALKKVILCLITLSFFFFPFCPSLPLSSSSLPPPPHVLCRGCRIGSQSSQWVCLPFPSTICQHREGHLFMWNKKWHSFPKISSNA